VDCAGLIAPDQVQSSQGLPGFAASVAEGSRMLEGVGG
jgi:hypothetical protein